MRIITCECGQPMEFDFVVIPGIEESEDFFVCKCGKKKDYYQAIHEHDSKTRAQPHKEESD